MPPPDWPSLRLALVGTDDLDDALSSIVYLRGRMPGGIIIALQELAAYDTQTLRRLLGAGADLVFDSRFSPSKVAMTIERFLRDQQDVEPMVDAGCATQSAWPGRTVGYPGLAATGDAC